MKRLRSHIALLVSSGLLLAALGIVGAQPAARADTDTDTDTSVSWSFTPSSASGPDGRGSIDVEADPGQQLNDHLAVRNLSDHAVAFSIAAHDGFMTDDGHFAMLRSSEPSVAAGLWIESAGAITVPAGEVGVLPVTIAIPSDASPGDHLAGLAASISSGGGTADGTGVVVESRIGFPVVIRVSGEFVPRLETEVLAADYRSVWNPFAPGSVDVSYAIRNTGNVALSVDHRATASGRPAAAPGPAEIEPGGERIVRAHVTGVWPWGWSTVVVEAEGARGDLETDRVRSELFVWAVPVPQLVVLLGAALLVLGVLHGRRRRRHELERMLEAAREEGARAAQALAGGSVR